VFHLSFSLSIAAIFGCREQHRAAPVTLSSDYEKGVSFLNRRNDSAYYYLNKAATGSKDSLQIAQAYNVMAVIQTREGDYYGGQESLLTSLRYLSERRENDQYCFVADYNVLGTNSLNLKNYDAAIVYYDQALKFAKDDRAKAIALNNKAVAYQKKGQYARAITIYESIITRSKDEKKEYARVLSNLARVRWLQNSDYAAAPELLTALKIRKEVNDNWGLNASYAHLADYYTHSRPDSALIYARDMYAVASHLESPDDELEALQKLIMLGPPKDLKQYFTQYQHLKDSLESARNSAKNQFALIRYDAEKSKTDNLTLQQENADKKVEIIQQRAISYGAIVAFVIVIWWGIVWYRRRKQKIERAAMNAIREDRLRTSQKVHDVVANGLYRIMVEIEHGENMEKEPLLDTIEALYEQSRDISYEQTKGFGDDFHATIGGLLRPFGESGTKVLIIGNEKMLWDDVRAKTKKELEPILLELMINMKKHSSARNVVVRFEREGNRVKVQYTDDGVGFRRDFRYGNGLTNTETRIVAIGGRIIFDKNTPTGLRIRIYIPNV